MLNHQSLEKCKTKPQRCHFTHQSSCNSRSQMIMWRHWNIPTLLVGEWNGGATLAVSQSSTQTLFQSYLRRSNSTRTCLPKRQKNLYPHGNFYMNIRSIFVIALKLKQPRCPSPDDTWYTLWLSTQWNAISNKEEWYIGPCHDWMNLRRHCAQRRKPNADNIYICFY